MNNHAEIRQRLAAYSGGDLDTAERNTISEHLLSCPDCRAELADLQTTLRLIRSTPEVDPPPWLTSRIMAQVKDQHAEQRSWLQRIFQPLHIKLPIEVMALLAICVSGYYLTRTVETGLDQTTRQQLQDIPVQQAPAPTPKPTQPIAREESETVPAASRRDQTLRAGTPAPTLQTPVPQTERPDQGTTSGASGIETVRPAPAADSFEQAPEAVQEKKKGVQNFLRKEEKTVSASPAGRAKAAAPTAALLPQTKIRLKLTDAASASEAVRQAIDNSGGRVVVTTGKQPTERQFTARIPASRFIELLGRLEKLGTIAERPVTSNVSGIIEVVVLW